MSLSLVPSSLPFIAWSTFFGYLGAIVGISIFFVLCSAYGKTILQILKNAMIFYGRVYISKYLEIGDVDDTSRKDLMTITYHKGNQRYKILSPKYRGPCPYAYITITRPVTDTISETVDVTHRIKKYAGPHHNFHGIFTTPNMLGYTNGISIHYRNATPVKHIAWNERIEF